MKYSPEFSEEKIIVRNTDGEEVARCEIDRDLNRRGYDDCFIKLDGRISKYSALTVAEYIAGSFAENPGIVSSANEVFRVAFPIYGGYVMECELTGENFDNYAWQQFILGIAYMICAIIRIWKTQMYKEAQASREQHKKVDKLVAEIISRSRELEETENVPTPKFGGYYILKDILD